MQAEGNERFVSAQAPVHDAVVDELRRGRKTSHWMWFVFPQLRGLGTSPRAHFYGLASADEARAYLAHPVLGPRLKQCVELVRAVEGRSVHDIFGSPDDQKLKSSLTLFEHVAPEDALFARVRPAVRRPARCAHAGVAARRRSPTTSRRYPMTAQQIKPELQGKTIESAAVLERPSGDAEFVMTFTDGSTATVAAWKREGHSLQMNVDLSPNEHPQTDGGTHRRHV